MITPIEHWGVMFVTYMCNELLSQCLLVLTYNNLLINLIYEKTYKNMNTSKF